MDHHALALKLSFQAALTMPISMVFHALAMLDSSRAVFQLVPHAKMELNGTELTVLLHQAKITALVDMFTTMFQTIASP